MYLEGSKKSQEVSMTEHCSFWWACSTTCVRECQAILLCHFDCLMVDYFGLFYCILEVKHFEFVAFQLLLYLRCKWVHANQVLQVAMSLQAEHCFNGACSDK